MAAREVGEEHQHALPFRMLGFMRQSEHDALFFPSRDAVGVAVGQQVHCFFEVRDDGFGGPGIGGSAQQQQESYRSADHAFFTSRPDIVPVEDANLPVSIPMRWRMETNRLGSG